MLVTQLYSVYSVTLRSGMLCLCNAGQHHSFLTIIPYSVHAIANINKVLKSHNIMFVDIGVKLEVLRSEIVIHETLFVILYNGFNPLVCSVGVETYHI